MSSSSIGFNRRYFLRNYRYFHSIHDCVFSNREILSYWYYLWAEISSFFDNLSPNLMENKNICIATVVTPLADVNFTVPVPTLSSNLYVFSDFRFIITVKLIRTFPFETSNSLPRVSAVFQKNIGRSWPCACRHTFRRL